MSGGRTSKDSKIGETETSWDHVVGYQVGYRGYRGIRGGIDVGYKGIIHPNRGVSGGVSGDHWVIRPIPHLIGHQIPCWSRGIRYLCEVYHGIIEWYGIFRVFDTLRFRVFVTLQLPYHLLIPYVRVSDTLYWDVSLTTWWTVSDTSSSWYPPLIPWIIPIPYIKCIGYLNKLYPIPLIRGIG